MQSARRKASQAILPRLPRRAGSPGLRPPPRRLQAPNPPAPRRANFLFPRIYTPAPKRRRGPPPRAGPAREVPARSRAPRPVPRHPHGLKLIQLGRYSATSRPRPRHRRFAPHRPKRNQSAHPPQSLQAQQVHRIRHPLRALLRSAAQPARPLRFPTAPPARQTSGRTRCSPTAARATQTPPLTSPLRMHNPLAELPSEVRLATPTLGVCPSPRPQPSLHLRRNGQCSACGRCMTHARPRIRLSRPDPFPKALGPPTWPQPLPGCPKTASPLRRDRLRRDRLRRDRL